MQSSLCKHFNILFSYCHDFAIKIEPLHKKTNKVLGQKQRCRSAPLFSLLGYYNPSSTKIQNFKPLAIFCDCTAWFVSDLDGNPN